jgi:hypothetical protein
MRATTSGKGSPQLKHFPSSQERQTLATRSAKEAPHKMHFVVVILRHLQPSLFFIVFVQGEPPFAPATWQTQWSASTTWQTQGSAPTIRYSPFAIRCRSSSRQSLITTRRRSRQSLPFSPLAIRYSPLTTLAISSPLSGYNQASSPQA